MKKTFLLIAVILATNFTINAQTDESKNVNYSNTNEIRLNTLYLLLGNFEVSYEHLINDYSGIGMTGTVNVDNNTIMDLNYMFLPYYRLYSGDDADEVFFEAGFAFYNNTVNNYTSFGTYNRVNESSFGPSLSLGKKRIYDNNITLETYFGICRNYNNSSDGNNLIVPRFGISLGKRF